MQSPCTGHGTENGKMFEKICELCIRYAGYDAPTKKTAFLFFSFKVLCEKLISHSRAHRIGHLATALHFHRQLSRLSCLHTCSLACHWVHTCITLCTCWLSAGDFFVQASGYIKIRYQVSCFLNEKTKPYSISHIWKNQLMYRAFCLQWLSDIYHPEPMRINWANQTVENGQLWASSTKSDCFLSSYPSEACHPRVGLRNYSAKKIMSSTAVRHPVASSVFVIQKSVNHRPSELICQHCGSRLSICPLPSCHSLAQASLRALSSGVRQPCQSQRCQWRHRTWTLVLYLLKE